MEDKPKKYCDGIDCAFCSEKEPCIYKIANRLESKLRHKEQELQEAMDNYVQLDLQRVKEYNELVDLYKAKEQECERLNEYSVGFARKCQKLELDVFHLKDKNYNLQRQLDQLKAENSKLKQRIIEIDRSYKNRQEELEQTLNEIKEIVNGDYEILDPQAKNAILQKINEVE